MAQPLARGLFLKAVTMSGQQVTASGPMNAARRTRAVFDYLKISHASELMDLSADRIVSAMATRDPILPSGGVYFGPVLDERSLKRHTFFPDAPA